MADEALTPSKRHHLFGSLSIGVVVIGIVVLHFVVGLFAYTAAGQAGVGRPSTGLAWTPALLSPELILIGGFISAAIWHRPRVWLVLTAAFVAALVATPLIALTG